MLKKLFQEEKGSALPLVTICLVVFMLGFSALIIDAGCLYLEKRILVAAADAGALAGAKELSDKLPDNSSIIQERAKNIAKEVAESNGADPNNILVIIESRNVKYTNLNGQVVSENRKIIEVKVKNNKKLIFANFLGYTDSDVGASAIATWGYLKSISGGDILPIFSMDTLYSVATTGSSVYLNGDKFMEAGSAIPGGVIVPGNWGLFDINKSSIDSAGVTLKSALSGEESYKEISVKSIIESESGNKKGQVDNVIKRMENAVKIYDKPEQIQERKQYMRGLVPIINYNLFKVLNPVDENGRLPNPLKLPIISFAVFEIRDYLSSDSTGADKALSTDTYLPDGIKKSYPGYSVNTIIGVYTGEKVSLRSEIVNGDQSLSEDEMKILTYEKLIQ